MFVDDTLLQWRIIYIHEENKNDNTRFFFSEDISMVLNYQKLHNNHCACAESPVKNYWADTSSNFARFPVKFEIN